jgi:hypothetical protein
MDFSSIYKTNGGDVETAMLSSFNAVTFSMTWPFFKPLGSSLGDYGAVQSVQKASDTDEYLPRQGVSNEDQARPVWGDELEAL